MSTAATSAPGSFGSDPWKVLQAIYAQMTANMSSLDFSPTFDAVSDMLCGVHAGYFNDQADPNGQPWKPLHAKTVDSRFLRDLGGGKIGDGKFGKPKEAAARAAGFGPDNTILIESGAMQSSVRFRTNGNHVEQIEPLSLEWGTKDPKAATHEFGAISRAYDERAERWIEIEIPARPFVGWSHESINKAVDNVADDAVGLLLIDIGP